MGRGGHRGRRPHKSPASIARSKQRPGKRERRAQRDAGTEASTTVGYTAASGADATSAAAPPATLVEASVNAEGASISGPAIPTAPKAKAVSMSTSAPSRLDPASPSAPPGSTFALLTRPKYKADPAIPPPRGNDSAHSGGVTSPPRPSLPEVALTAPSSEAIASATLPSPDCRWFGTARSEDAQTAGRSVVTILHLPVPAHSDALCPCLGPRQLSPALGSTSCTLSHTLRFVSITAHSRRGGHVSHTASFVTIVAALQTITCCDALLPAPGGHDVRWEAGASSLLPHTDDASGSCSGGSDCLDRRSRPRLPWLFTCPAQRLAQLENALPPLFLRKGLRLRPSQQRPPSEDGSMPASTSFYMTRGGVLRTPKTSWPRPRHNWNPSLDVTYLNASGYCQKDAISLGSCRHFGRGSAFALDDASICYRRILQRTPVQGLLGPPMFKAPGQRRQLPLTPGHMLLDDGREWRRGSVDRLVKTSLYFLGSRPLCFSSSLCLRPSKERLAFTAAYDFIISVLRCPVRLPFPMDGTTFSSHMPRNAGPAQLPLVRDAAVRLHDYGRRPGKDSALSCIQAPARMQTRRCTPSRIGPRLHFCLCLDHASRFPCSKPSSSGRAGFGFQPLLGYGRELGRRCCRKSCTLHCTSLCDGDWGACYCRSTSLQRRACRRGHRRRRRRIAHCRPPRGWRLLFRWHTLRVVPGGYVRRRLLCPSLIWPCCYSRNGRRWHTPPRWSSRASGRHCGLHRSAALIVAIACAASTCHGAPFSLTAGLCGALSFSSVGVCLALLLGLANLVALYWHISHILLRSSTSSHISSAFTCRCI